MAISVEDRRIGDRIRVEIPVRFCSEMLDFNGDAEFVAGMIQDLSSSGFYIRSEFLELPGVFVQLLVHMPDREQPLFLEGRVAWYIEEPPKGPGMGIQLTSCQLSEDLIQQLRH